MASLFLKVGQKLRRSLRGISTCVIRGTKEDIFFPGHMFQPILPFAAEHPIIKKFQSGRLFEVNPDSPNHIQDSWRRILFSGMVHSVNCKNNSDSICDAFDLNNVGVLRDFNILAFRRFERGGAINTNHDGFCRFVYNLFTCLYGPLAFEQLNELQFYLSLFEGSSVLPDYYLLHNPIYLDSEGIANFYMDSHRLIRHAFGLRRQGHSAARILLDLESSFENGDVACQCEKNVLLKCFLGSHNAMQRAMTTKRFSGPPPGSTVVDIHRHAATHSIERSTLENARASVSSSSVGVLHLLKTYTRQELIDWQRNEFALYPQQVALSFEDNLVWYTLRMPRRLPIPDVYKYRLPDPDQQYQAQQYSISGVNGYQLSVPDQQYPAQQYYGYHGYQPYQAQAHEMDGYHQTPEMYVHHQHTAAQQPAPGVHGYKKYPAQQPSPTMYGYHQPAPEVAPRW